MKPSMSRTKKITSRKRVGEVFCDVMSYRMYHPLLGLIINSSSRKFHFTFQTKEAFEAIVCIGVLCTCIFTRLPGTFSEKRYFYHMWQELGKLDVIKKLCDASRQNVCLNGKNRTYHTFFISSHTKCSFIGGMQRFAVCVR